MKIAYLRELRLANSNRERGLTHVRVHVRKVLARLTRKRGFEALPVTAQAANL